MSRQYKNYVIIKLINALKATHATYWELYRLDDEELLKLYKILVDKEGEC